MSRKEATEGGREESGKGNRSNKIMTKNCFVLTTPLPNFLEDYATTDYVSNTTLMSESGFVVANLYKN